MNKKTYALLAMVLIALTSLTLSGCGKNIIGPTEPNQDLQIIDQDTTALNTSGDPESVSAACRGMKIGQVNLFWKYWHYVGGFFLKHTAKFLVQQWFGDELLTKRFSHVINSPIFNIIFYQCGVAPLLLGKSLAILTDVWAPGLGTNPRNTEPEITLLPYNWTQHQGFYGERMPGWGNGHGYHLEAKTAENDIIGIQAVSTPVNVFNNLNPIDSVWWNYTYSPHEYTPDNVTKYLRIGFYYAACEKRFYVNDLLVGMDNQRILNQDIWFSTEDKSGHCKITSGPEMWLEIDLTFDASGAGGGYVKIINWRNQIDTYEFTMLAKGHGYFTKNGGRKHRF